jgi:hypothetical protein
MAGDEGIDYQDVSISPLVLGILRVKQIASEIFSERPEMSIESR